MKTYPMLYSLRELVEGKGYFARVALDGRALATEEEPGEWWAYGVNPGAIAASGETVREAFAALQRSFRAYLLDCAASAPSFEAFKWEVERFFHESNPDSQQEWEEAVQAIRAGAAIPANLGKQSENANPRRILVCEAANRSPARIEVGGDVEVAA